MAACCQWTGKSDRVYWVSVEFWIWTNRRGISANSIQLIFVSITPAGTESKTNVTHSKAL